MKADSVGYWKDKKGKLLKRYKTLTDKDLRFDEGKEEEMIKILAYKLGKTEQELLNIIITL
jgi:glutaredoxin-related protein